MEEILITGGLGYIGSHTALQLIAQGYAPVIVDNLCNTDPATLDRIEAISGVRPPLYAVDCRDISAMENLFREHPNLGGVIHFAALKAVGESVENPLVYYRNNLDSLLTLLELSIRFGVPRFVFSSSATVYGQPTELPVNEESPLCPPQSPYGATKLMAEQILTDVVRAHRGVRVVALRYFNPIGAHPSGRLGELPRGVPNNLLPYITQTARGVREQLQIFGSDYNTPDGTALRDYFHVMDLARAHTLSLDFMKGETAGGGRVQFINVGAGRPVSVLEIVQGFERVNGVKVPYRLAARRAGDVEAVWADTTLAERTLGWKPNYTLEDALHHAWLWEQHLAILG